MRTIIVGLVAVLTFCGCGPSVRTISSADVQPAAYVMVETIAVDSEINLVELGYVIFLRVTSTTNTSATGALVRYPEDGVVLALHKNEVYSLSPRVQIPVRDDVQVEVSVFALPNQAPIEALNILAFVLPQAGKFFVAQAPLAPLVGRALGRATIEARKALEKGRMIAYHSISAIQLAQTSALTISGMSVTAVAVANSDSTVPMLKPLNPAEAAASDQPFFMTELVYEADLAGKTAFQLDIMRNEIYARHGRGFVRDDLRAYFEAQPWYTARVSADAFDPSVLTAIQRQNADFILVYQNQHGLRVRQ